VLSAVMIALGIGTLVLGPSLFWMYVIFQRQRPGAPTAPE